MTKPHTESETPRTDEFSKLYFKLEGFNVWIDFSRQLELENAELRAKIEEAIQKYPDASVFEHINLKFRGINGVPWLSVRITAEEWEAACDWMKRSTKVPVSVPNQPKHWQCTICGIRPSLGHTWECSRNPCGALERITGQTGE